MIFDWSDIITEWIEEKHLPTTAEKLGQSLVNMVIKTSFTDAPLKAGENMQYFHHIFWLIKGAVRGFRKIKNPLAAPLIH